MKTFTMLQLFSIHITIDVCSASPVVKGCLCGLMRITSITGPHTLQIQTVLLCQQRRARQNVSGLSPLNILDDLLGDMQITKQFQEVHVVSPVSCRVVQRCQLSAVSSASEALLGCLLHFCSAQQLEFRPTRFSDV